MYKRCAESTVLNPKPCRYKRCAESTLMLSGTNHECRQKQIDGLFWSVIIKFSKHNVLFTYEEYFGSRQHGMPGPVVLEKYCVYLWILIKFGFASFGKLRYFQSFVKAKVNTYFNNHSNTGPLRSVGISLPCRLPCIPQWCQQKVKKISYSRAVRTSFETRPSDSSGNRGKFSVVSQSVVSLGVTSIPRLKVWEAIKLQSVCLAESLSKHICTDTYLNIHDYSIQCIHEL